jgi:hypothetical protein
VYSHTENDITIRGTRADRHHVETISLPKNSQTQPLSL